MMPPLVRLLVLATLVAAPAACSSPDGPSTDPSFTILRMGPDAPPLETLDTAFWAVRGQDREVQVRYESPTYGYGKCLRLVVPAQALPAGVAPGDSVRITVHVVSPELFQFDFGPAGLKFDPSHPAQLQIRYTFADPDLNGDGQVDARDQNLAKRLAIYRRETSHDPWERLPTTLDANAIEADAEVTGFTQYALASE
ncbi:MAG TPA: hypothetical protein VFL93_07075 [Longimicrobiaceae bacterium]|nr:hypothetical protein [Longimicrobiaceae bacterium]